MLRHEDKRLSIARGLYNSYYTVPSHMQLSIFCHRIVHRYVVMSLERIQSSTERSTGDVTIREKETGLRCVEPDDDKAAPIFPTLDLGEAWQTRGRSG